MRSLATVLALLGAAAPPALAQRPPAREAVKDPVAALVGRLQKFYESTKDLHARFTQTLETGVGRKRTASGEVWLKKPGKMRWDYQRPEKKLMVADGTTLWVYEPEDEQAFKQDLRSSALPSSVTFLWGAGRLSDEFEIAIDKVEGLGGPGQVVLKLVPRKPSAQLRLLHFVVAESDARVVETVVHDPQGGTNRMTFLDVETNRGVSEERFQFTPPAGTRVLKP